MIAFVCKYFFAILAYSCKYGDMECDGSFKENSGKLLNLFKALGDKNRLNILNHFCRCSLLGTKENSVNDVKSCCDVDLSVISRHLASLKKAGVLNAKKEGKQVLYSLNAKEITRILRELADSIDRCCSNKNNNTKEKL